MKLTFLMLFLITTSAFSQFSKPIDIFDFYNISGGSGTSYLTVDFDLDSDLDFVSNNGNIYLLKNNGLGVFEKIQLTDNFGYSSMKMIAEDINNDGYLDLICKNLYSNSKIYIHYNEGNNQISSENIIDINSDIFSEIEVLDIDNDSNKDILLKKYTEPNKLYLYRNSSSSIFYYDSINFNANIKSYADIDSDGDIDILLKLGSNNYFKLNDGNGSYIDSTSVFISSNTDNIKYIDLDNDSDLDFYRQYNSLGNSIVDFYENNGSGSFILANTTNLGNVSTSTIILKDINDDELPDILTSASYYSTSSNFHGYKLNNGNLTFSSELSFNFIGIEKNGYVSIEDFDNNGFIDILTSELVFFKSNSLLNFDTGYKLCSRNKNALVFELNDLNSDNIEDIVYSTNDGIYLKYGQNDSTYSTDEFVIYSNPLLYYMESQIFIEDLNNDGLKDIFFIADNGGAASIKFLLSINNGDSTFTSSLISNYTNPRNVLVSDVNNDNFKDIVFFTTGLSQINYFENLQNGTFAPVEMLCNIPNLGVCFTFYDIDNDNDKDLILAKNSGQSNEIFYSENNGIIPYVSQNTILSETIGIKSKFFYFEDFNLDGIKDLIYDSEYLDTILNNNYTLINIYTGSSFGGYNFNSSKIKDQFYKVQFKDVNLDGYVDILGIEQSQLKCFLQNSFSGFDDEISFQNLTPIGVRGFKLREINNDLIFKPISSSSFGLALSKNNFKNNIKIKQFVDLNSNQEFDGFDIPIPHKQSFLTPSNVSYYGNNQGISFASDLTVGLNDLISQNVSNFNLTSNSPSFQIIHDNDSIYNCNFAFEPDTIINDFDLNLVGGFPRCNSTINYWLDIENIGTTYPNGIIELKLDSVLVLSSTSITPDSINGNIVYWSFDSLNYFESKQIQVSINTPGFLNIGDTMRSFLTVTVYDSLTNSSISFEDSLSQILVCAYDPNDKIVEPSGYSDEGYIKNDTEWLEYTVRFQNTGNDTAINVVILDQLDSNLDWNSLEILSSSDVLSASINNSGIITFAFNNIYLPDSTIDEIGSHGFVNYKIKLNDNLSTGIKIFNGASIYFDYNPPIYTNYTVNTIYDCDDIVQLNFPENSCENTEINGSINIMFDTLNTSWKINGVQYSTENEFNWIFDSSGIYSVEVLSNGNLCTIDSMKNITIFQKPSILISPILNDTICQENLPINLPLVNPNGGLWISPYTSSNSYNPPNNIIGNQFLVYHFVDSNNCTNKDSVSVFINQTPQVELIEFQFDTLCQNHFPYLLPNVTPLNGVWNSIDVSGGVFNPTTINIGNQELVYTFIDSNSCKNSDTLKLLIEECLSINELDNNIKIYPNPFNDKLYLENIPFDQYEIIIYDIAGNIKYYNTSNNTEENKLINLDFNSGFYFLKITTQNLNKEYFFKIVKI